MRSGQPSPLWRTYGIYRSHWRLGLVVLLASLLANGSFGYQQHLFGRALEYIRLSSLGEVAPGGLWTWIIIIAVVVLIRALIGYAGQILGMVLGQRLLFQLRSHIYRQVVELDQSFHRAHGGGELIARTTRDSDKVRDAVVIGTRNLLDSGTMLLGGIAYVLWCDWLLGGVQLVLMLAAIVILIKQADRLVLLNRAADDAYDGVTQDFTEGVVGIRVIKAFNQEAARLRGFLTRLGGFMDHARRALLFTATWLPMPQMLVAAGHGWVLWYGAVLVGQGDIDTGSYIACLMLVMGLVFRMDGIGRIVRIMADARASAARVWEVLDADNAVRSGSEDLPTGPLGLRLDRVSVRTAAGQPILEDCDLHLEPGQIVALVGPTGSGKSTLCSLFPRLRDPDAGSVRIGNDQAGWIDVDRLRLAELRQRVQVGYQGSFLFSDTVAANLRLARAEASDADLEQALVDAAADEIVADLPQGLATRIGERGLTLSGGQRQRLALARALVAQPDVLLLDDATSALDAVTENRILERLRASARGATVLLVATRLSSILLADRVLLLDRGRIVASGTHRELAAGNRAYRELLCLDEHGEDTSTTTGGGHG